MVGPLKGLDSVAPQHAQAGLPGPAMAEGGKTRGGEGGFGCQLGSDGWGAINRVTHIVEICVNGTDGANAGSTDRRGEHRLSSTGCGYEHGG